MARAERPHLGADARALALLVALAGLLPYVPTIDDYFTQDDFGVVQLLASKPWSTFPRWFAMPWMENIWGYTPDEIRPFVAFTYQVTALAGAGRPELHHILNILIHAANALLVMAIARSAVGLGIAAAGFAGLLFALLPVQAESVAWITGRVDSMPAFFYLATFLAYVHWRREGGAFTSRWYVLAIVLFFVALFSKQNTITMVATLAAYDVLMLWHARVRVKNAIAAWTPFAAMTIGYLVLRRMLFGASVRGGLESWDQVASVGAMIGRHMQRTVLGHVGTMANWEIGGLVLLGVALLVAVARSSVRARQAACFGAAWWIVGVAPVLVAGYESPRHVYLASAAWAFLLGILLDANRGDAKRPDDTPSESEASARHRAPIVRAVTTGIAIAVVVLYAVRLLGEVRTWGEWSRTSKIAVDAVGEAAATAPPGTLLLVSVPQKSWEWATPFVVQPPYIAEDLSGRVNLVTPFRLHCCGPPAWHDYTRERLRAWATAAEPRPIVALHVAASGAVSQLSDRDAPELRSLAHALMQLDSWQTLDRNIVRLMEERIRRH